MSGYFETEILVSVLEGDQEDARSKARELFPGELRRLIVDLFTAAEICQSVERGEE